jgi:hypothetical protein
MAQVKEDWRRQPRHEDQVYTSRLAKPGVWGAPPAQQPPAEAQN